MIESTHHVSIHGDQALKTYRRCYDDEHRREWTALRLLHRYAPGLAPEPIRLRTNGAAPEIQMTRVPGEPLGGSHLSTPRVDALGLALRRLHASVPDNELADLPERRWAPVALTNALKSWLNQPSPPPSAEVETALDAARTWVDGTAAAAYTGTDAEKVFVHGDGNVGNFVCDGDRCSIVDFEDSGCGDPAYEVADLVEHVTVSLPGLLDPRRLVEAIGLTRKQKQRYSAYRRTLAAYWLFMLLPNNPAHHRNPGGSVDRQARHVLELLT